MLLIFDCDGVLVDSEHLACVVEADYLTTLGLPFTPDEIARRFVGVSMKDMIATLTGEHGARIPADFAAELTRRTLARFETELVAIEGVRAAILATNTMRCVASSSTPERIAFSLKRAGLADLFDPAAIFSSTMVARGKPAPDLFLHAARAMNRAPADCLVIEDSVAGATAAVAAGMRVIGFCGGAHVQGDLAHEEKLRKAGARDVIRHMRELGAALAA